MSIFEGISLHDTGVDSWMIVANQRAVVSSEEPC